MLYPYESRSREVKDISGVWRFKLDRDGVGMKERWYEKKLEGSIPMPVPASYNDITQEADVRDYVGEVWYEKTVTIP
ncbi:MAG: beta-glucuronidase, partial [Hungatella hathewayi]|nr:beta-glucuronidase [Hungatella hathewayi]